MQSLEARGWAERLRRGHESRVLLPQARDAGSDDLTGLLAWWRARLPANDEFDLVAVGRALLVDPDWAQKVREGREQDILPFSREALMTLV